jgi:hypothetical protein
MTRHTWGTLLLATVLAGIGYAGLRRGSWRTAYRYRLIAPVVRKVEVTEAEVWAESAEQQEAA